MNRQEYAAQMDRHDPTWRDRYVQGKHGDRFILKSHLTLGYKARMAVLFVVTLPIQLFVVLCAVVVDKAQKSGWGR